VRLYPVQLQFPGLRGEHVGEVVEGHARGNRAGVRQELGAFAVRVCVPGNVCQWIVIDGSGSCEPEVLWMDAPESHAERGRWRRCDLHATPRVLARKVAGELHREQGHVVGMLGPEQEEEWVADDLHSQAVDLWCRELLFRPVGGC
jgi:hypothetical protein